MSEKLITVTQERSKPIKLLKWKVVEGNTISIGKIIFLYEIEGDEKSIPLKLKCSKPGKIHKIFVEDGAVVSSGLPLYELKLCNHPTIINDMCAECGADLQKDGIEAVASVPMVHAIPDLKVSEEQAKIIGKADSDRLLHDRKLVLLVDLDQTLIHTTNDNIPANIKNVYHFQLYGSHSPWYHTRLRPGTHQFLENIHSLYELHICTFGTRNYAHMIATFLDKDQKMFSNRILSRDECFDATSKKANLSALFPCGDNMVCIIDDREDVWSNAKNLIHVKPYHFFRHTGDINAPPGLDKHEEDEITGVDLNKMEKIKNGNNKLNDCGIDVNDDDVDDNYDRELLNNEMKKEDPMNLENGKFENTEDDQTLITANKNLNSPLNMENSNATEISQDDSQKMNISADENLREKLNYNDKNSQQEKSSMEKFKDKEDVEKNEFFDVEDPDCYLLYLESILKQIHKTFYEKYDTMESGEVPDLKQVIPAVKSEVLIGTKLCFSGLVPTHVKLERSKAYLIAKSLGANVSQGLDDDTTHLVAVRPGTAKVNLGKRKKNLKIVTPDWLWCCAERWEHVDERIFPLNSKGSKNRHPPPHCSSPEHVPEYPVHNNPIPRKRTPSGRFMDTIHPLMSFSSADIADMDKEVEDILDDESESSEEEEEKHKNKSLISDSSTSSSSGEFITTQGKKRVYKETLLNNSEDEIISGDEDLSLVKFYRKEIPENVEEWESQDAENSLDLPDEGDDGEWNIMGAALEKEFLSND